MSLEKVSGPSGEGEPPSEALSPVTEGPNHLNEMIQLIRLTSMQGPLAKIKKDGKPMAKVSIPGMSTVFGDASSPCRRVTWTLVLLACLSIATIQVRVFPNRAYNPIVHQALK